MKEIKNYLVCNSTSFKEHLKSKDFSVSKEDFTILKCKDCNFHFTSPRPKNEELGRYYISDHYISHNNTSKNLFEKVYQLVRRIAIKGKYDLISGFFNKGRILDIGCGTGDFLNKCKTEKWRTKGIEPSEIAKKQAISNYNLDVDEDIDLRNLI